MNSKDNAESMKTTQIDLNEIAQMLIGPNKRISDRVIMPISIGNQLKTKDELRVEAIFESCSFKTVTSCAVGKLTW